MADFLPCVQFTLRPENEGAYVDNPADPGGPTNYGITLDGLSAWRGHTCSATDVRKLTMAQAQEIYQAHYWLPIGGDALPLGLDLMVFDFGVNHGPGSATRMLQRLVGAVQDGDAGPDTIHRATCTGGALRERINKLAADQQAFYAALHNPTFGKGWAARTTRRQAAAITMISGAAPAKKGSSAAVKPANPAAKHVSK